jgi:7-cyano-7-deazaguanine synthase
MTHAGSSSFPDSQTPRRADQAPAVVLLSGGLDSATTLAIARDRGFRCHALAIDYGQRHRHELAAARRQADELGAAAFRLVSVDLRAIGGSALTDEIDVPKAAADAPVPGGIPVTYVPARNLVFLSIAAGFAETIEAHDIFTGVNAVDYSGYPDCRRPFIDSFEQTATLATRAGTLGASLRVHTPLVELTKGEIIRTGIGLGVDYAGTHSCYDPDQDGAACGGCESCRLRRRGFAEAGVPDPTRYAPGCVDGAAP